MVLHFIIQWHDGIIDTNAPCTGDSFDGCGPVGKLNTLNGWRMGGGGDWWIRKGMHMFIFGISQYQ